MSCPYRYHTLYLIQLISVAAFALLSAQVAMAQNDFMRHGNHDDMPAQQQPLLVDSHDAIATTNDDPLAMQGTGMNDDFRVGMLLIDQIETYHSQDQQGRQWDIEGWYGGDINKLWLFTEGSHRNGWAGESNLEAYWSHAIAAFWDMQLGVREDYGAGPDRHWAAIGIQGLAPYWFEVKAGGYVDPDGRLAARLRTKYELLFTQRLILQPELETNFYSRTDSAHGIGRGLSDLQLGLRLRYEFHRQFAPYLGINWLRRLGRTADYARAENLSESEHQLIIGIRCWF
jgi:copper resistance protein B